MKLTVKIATVLALAGSLALAGNNLTIGKTQQAANNDPFTNMDKVFEMQMRQMRQMQRQMDAMFSNFEQSFQSPNFRQTPRMIHSSGVFSSGFQDLGDHYELKIRVQDLNNSKVDIQANGGMITVTTSLQKKQEQTKGNYGKVISFASSSSTQSFTLPTDADASTIKATQKNNTISITLKKKGATSNSKVIPISTKESNTSK